ncbi:MAG TPA: ribosome biogenesis GTP-binding protein YihA/YsxC [Sandaracinaceae bacterium]
MQVLDASYVATATEHSALPPPAYAEIAFAGRSNVGKSSLINRLVGRKKLVRTSSTPGCTRALSLFRARLRLGEGDEARIDLVDLPGYGFAKRSKKERRAWGPMIEGFLRERPGLRAVVVIVDVRRGPEDDDLDLLAFLEELRITPIVVATKIDKLPASKRKPALAALARKLGAPPVGFSSVTGDGVEELWRRILRAAALGAGSA